jgi:hypothetical protein
MPGTASSRSTSPPPPPVTAPRLLVPINQPSCPASLSSASPSGWKPIIAPERFCYFPFIPSPRLVRRAEMETRFCSPFDDCDETESFFSSTLSRIAHGAGRAEQGRGLPRVGARRLRRLLQPQAGPSLPELAGEKNVSIFFFCSTLSESRIAFIRRRSFKTLTSSLDLAFNDAPWMNFWSSPSNSLFQSLHTCRITRATATLLDSPVFVPLPFFYPTPSTFGHLSCFAF